MSAISMHANKNGEYWDKFGKSGLHIFCIFIPLLEIWHVEHKILDLTIECVDLELEGLACPVAYKCQVSGQGPP